MNSEHAIAKLIKGTIHRAIRESVAGVFVIFAFTYLLLHSSTGTVRYYGWVVLLLATPFVLAVIWAYTLNYKQLRAHPPSDIAFWHDAFTAQARLLRLVPLWYLAPLCSGILLVVAAAPKPFASMAVRLLLLGAFFAGVTWLNRAAAARIEKDAASLKI